MGDVAVYDALTAENPLAAEAGKISDSSLLWVSQRATRLYIQEKSAVYSLTQGSGCTGL